MPPKVKRKPKQKKVEIKASRGFVVGDFATVINNFWDEKIIKKFSFEQRFGFIVVFLSVVGVGIWLFLSLKPDQKQIMTGEFRIAIASFVENGQNLPDEIGYTIGDGIKIRLASDFEEITVGPKVEIWGPDMAGTVKGTTSQERAESAEKLAQEIHAHMIIYGVIEEKQNVMMVIPEFYLDTQGFHEGSEIIGQYYLGSSFPLSSPNNPAWQFDFDRQMQTRSDIVSSLAVGLSYYAVREYDSALETLQQLEAVEEWQDDQGKEVLYALMGFAAGEAKQYDLTQTALEKAIAINPDYSRPYIGLANLNYIQALKPVEISQNIDDVDKVLLDKCFEYLDLAVNAPEKPPLADVDTKIHFARGQCYWLKTFIGELSDYNLAIAEFQEVIDAYNNGENPRVYEFAGESYARLGLIYKSLNKQSEAVSSYQKAAEILANFPERQAVYQKRANELLGITPTP